MIEVLIFGLIILSVVCLWILIERRKEPKFLVWFIPVLLILVTSTYFTYTAVLGFPKFGDPKVGGIYLTHLVDEPNWVYLWMLEKGVPRAYKIIYSREIHNALEGVKGEAEKGNYMKVEKGLAEGVEADLKGDGRGEGFTIGGDRSFYKWDYMEAMQQKE